MPLRLDVASGGEYLLPFAKKKLAELRTEASRRRAHELSKVIQVDSGSSIFIQTVGTGPFYDTIRITAGGGWLAKSPTTPPDEWYDLKKQFKSDTREGTRLLQVDECFIGKTRYTTFTRLVSGIMYLVVKNMATSTETTLSLGAIISAQVTAVEFSLFSTTECWAVAFIDAGGLTTCAALSTSGRSMTADPTDFSLGSDGVNEASAFPIGLRNGDPYFFIDGNTVAADYQVFLITPTTSTMILNLPKFAGISSGYANSSFRIYDTGGSVTDVNGVEHIELVWQTYAFDGSFNFHWSLYGYSTATGLAVLDSGVLPITSDGAQTFLIKPGTDRNTRRGQLQLRDRRSNACVYSGGHIYALAQQQTLDITLTQTASNFGAVSVQGYSPVVSIPTNVDGFASTRPSFSEVPFVTDNFAGFAVNVIPPSGVGNSQHFITTAGVETITDTSSLITSDVNKSQLFYPTRRFVLREANEVVIFFDYVKPNTPSPGRTAYRAIYKVAAGTKTIISTYSFTTAMSGYRRSFLDGLIYKGAAYIYALAEDTPGTDAGTHLRLITNSPGSTKTYLVVVNSSGAIVATLRNDVTTSYAVDATQPSFG